MIYRINIRLDEEDQDEQYEVTIGGECAGSEVQAELMGAATVAAERIIRSLPEIEAFRQVG